jgi:prepilin-type N-terminal cleavage/methylation domain-containing protein
MNINKKAFTLIELLVVVLIIGILAAIAWPKYQVAVMRSKIISALPLLKAVAAAQERYKLATGSYSYGADLDITIPGCSGNACQIGDNSLSLNAKTNVGRISFIFGRGINPCYISYFLIEGGSIGGVEVMPGDILCYDHDTPPPLHPDRKPNSTFAKACMSFSPIASEIFAGTRWGFLIRGF